MKIIKPSISVEAFNSAKVLKKIEAAGRTCYKSENKITAGSSVKFIKNLIAREHFSVLEHFSITVRIICDRGVSHELVRHRTASFSQESTRYVSYIKGMEVIEPCFLEKNSDRYNDWINIMANCELNYQNWIEDGRTPQEARCLLPNSLKTEIVVTMNLRAWRNFLKLRCSLASHPQMREIALMILTDFHSKLPEIFGKELYGLDK